MATEKKRILIPSSATNEKIKEVAAELFDWGYTVRRGKVKVNNVNVRYIEIQREDDTNA